MPKTIKIACAGYSVVADVYSGDKTNVLLALVGWTSNRKRYDDILTAIASQTHMTELVFDYSGHGDSPFDIETTRPAQHFLEVICVFDWLKDKYPKATMTVMGTSYGGFLATQLTKYRNFDKLVLRAPAIYKPEDFYSLPKDIDREWTDKVFRKDEKALARHPLLKRASNFKGKTLVVVHEEDELVPKQTTDAYTKAFGAEVYVAKGFTHSIYDVPRPQIIEYQRNISNWLNKQA